METFYYRYYVSNTPKILWQHHLYFVILHQTVGPPKLFTVYRNGPVRKEYMGISIVIRERENVKVREVP